MEANHTIKTLKSKQSDCNQHIGNGKVVQGTNGSLSDQELKQIKEELGLIDNDGNDNPGSSFRNGDYVNSDSDDSEPTTPFDNPLTEAERRLLDQFTFNTYCPSPTTSRSASLAEVADSLISDLEKYDIGRQHGDEDETDSEFEGDSDQGKEDSDLGSSLSVTSGVEGLERLVEQLVQRKESQDMSTTLPMDNSTQQSTVNDDSSSDNTDSLPASIDSGIPALATTTPHRYFVVVAIDFGTTFSGYAFAFTRDPAGAIHMMRRWEGGDPGVTNQKTPTTLLLRPDGSFHSFGFGARDFYHDLEPDEARKWMFFEKFKMALHSQKVRVLSYSSNYIYIFTLSGSVYN